MNQSYLFDGDGTPTPEAHASGVAAACSAEAYDKVDVARLRRMTEAEFLLFPTGTIADEVAHRMRQDVLSIRPRVTELKDRGVLVETGERRRNGKGNSCAVLRHVRFQEGA